MLEPSTIIKQTWIQMQISILFVPIYLHLPINKLGQLDLQLIFRTGSIGGTSKLK